MKNLPPTILLTALRAKFLAVRCASFLELSELSIVALAIPVPVASLLILETELQPLLHKLAAVPTSLSIYFTALQRIVFEICF